MDHRSERISEALREELSELISYEMSDPRVGGVVVTAVYVSPDKRRAQVRIGMPAETVPEEALRALDHARSFLRRQLANRLEMYRVPDLHFEVDPAAQLGGRLEHLLRRIRKGRPREGESLSEKKAVD